MGFSGLALLTGKTLTMAKLAADLAIVGTGIQAAGMAAQGRTQAAWAEFSAAQAKADAQRLEQAATLEEKHAALEAGRERKEAGRFKGRQRALYAKSGVTMTETTFDVLAETADELEFEAQMTEYGGALRAGRFRQEAGLSTQQARVQRLHAKSLKRAGRWGMATTILTGGSQALANYELMR